MDKKPTLLVIGVKLLNLSILLFFFLGVYYSQTGGQITGQVSNRYGSGQSVEYDGPGLIIISIMLIVFRLIIGKIK